MNQRRLFTLLNLLLVGGCGALIYYLANVSYFEPPEIRETVGLLKKSESNYSAAGQSAPADPKIAYPKLNNVHIFDVLYKLTPTPTPTPRPTATPVPLADMLHPWALGAITADSITVTDQATKEEFELKIGGPGRSVTALGATITVTLEKVDMAADPPEATVKASTGDTRVLKLQ